MKPATTVQLRLRGITPLHLANAIVSAAPFAMLAWFLVVKQAHLASGSLLLGGAALVALLPWLSRGVARATYRARCDDVALHVRGEALPYKTIRELRVERTPRRTTLHLVRSEDIQLALVLRDAFAGRLEPIAVLRERLAAHGLTFDDA
jgi:hypothetical protein